MREEEQLLFGSKRRREKALELRLRGDAARENGQWREAADAYRDYLTVRPQDFGLWVQLGHALKEVGDYRASGDAYERARLLKPDDADLLLNIGHLRKLEGRYEAAARAYLDSVAADHNGYALRELASTDLSEYLGEADRRIVQAGSRRLVEPFRRTCRGLIPIAGSDLAFRADGTVELMSNDPWISFEVDRVTTGEAPVGEFTVQLAELPGSSTPNGRLYVDYGKGWTETDSIELPPGRGPITLLLAAPARIRKMRWDLDDRPGVLGIAALSFTPVMSIEALCSSIDRQQQGATSDQNMLSLARIMFENDPATLQDPLLLTRLLSRTDDGRAFDYLSWRERYASLTTEDYTLIEAMVSALPNKPSFSFVVPAYDTPPKLLRECMDSMLAQTYPHFEICVVDDCSPSAEIATILSDYASRYPNVKFERRRHNGHISSASNSALRLAEGDFIVLVDHDDIIPDYALATVAYYINRHPDAKVFYSDEDKVNLDGIAFQPYFKSEFNQFLMYGHNMISHLGVYQRKLLIEIGGFRKGLEGSQDYDLALRAYERIGGENIVHIPHILYHWRAIPGSTAVSAGQKSYAAIAAQQAINCHFERTKTPLRSVTGFAPGVTGVVAERELDTPLTIIIPTRDGLDMLEPCIASIDAHAPANIDILVVDNGSEEAATLAYLKRIAHRSDVTVLPHPHPFNYSEINNAAARHARGELICFLNNDTEVIAPDWIDRARGLLALPTVGAVGARLLYDDDTVQHFGIYLGMAQHRVASLPHSGLSSHLPGYFGKARLLQEFSAATAACLFMRKADFERVGGFDPTLRVAYNDVDLCMRIRQAGLKIVCDPGIELYHKESKSRGRDVSGASAERLNREAAIMRERWGSILDRDPYYSPNLALDRNDFALAHPPRIDFPWRTGTVPQEKATATSG